MNNKPQPLKTNHTDYSEYTGYIRLVYAIIEDGLRATRRGKSRDRLEAREFVYSPDFEHWCSWVDLDAGYLRRQVRAPQGMTK